MCICQCGVRSLVGRFYHLSWFQLRSNLRCVMRLRSLTGFSKHLYVGTSLPGFGSQRCQVPGNIGDVLVMALNSGRCRSAYGIAGSRMGDTPPPRCRPSDVRHISRAVNSASCSSHLQVPASPHFLKAVACRLADVRACEMKKCVLSSRCSRHRGARPSVRFLRK